MLLKPKPPLKTSTGACVACVAISNFTHASLIPHSKPGPAQEYQRTPPNALAENQESVSSAFEISPKTCSEHTEKEATTHSPKATLININKLMLMLMLMFMLMSMLVSYHIISYHIISHYSKSFHIKLYHIVIMIIYQLYHISLHQNISYYSIQ